MPYNSAKILVINTGSSSLKFQLIEMLEERAIVKGLCERIGDDKGHIKYTKKGRTWEFDVPMADHKEAFREVKKLLMEGETRAIKSLDEIYAIGHRAVQGGERYREASLLTQDVKDALIEMMPLAPIHNRATLAGFEAAEEAFGSSIPQVACFDNSFHNTLKPEAYIYALPYEFYTDLKIRKYGYHGMSQRYVTERLRELYPAYRRVISCHLGSGASLSAVLDGKCVDTTMGLTPLGGIMMGTRCGNIDPAIIPDLQTSTGMTPQEIDTIMNQKSGLLGLSGISSDIRDIEAAAEEGNERARLALDLFVYTAATYIAAITVSLGGLDAIVFTAGIGEKDAYIRKLICDRLTHFGVVLDDTINEKVHGRECSIASLDSRVGIFVIPTNEELIVARDTLKVVYDTKKQQGD
ncbi:MAG: acetate kinase [Clostridia bacterium]|nr:acetate kinase [Clostridia bacterium]